MKKPVKNRLNRLNECACSFLPSLRQRLERVSDEETGGEDFSETRLAPFEKFFTNFSKKELTNDSKKSLIEIFPLNGSSLKFTLCD